jgi:hypothetical protein
VCTQCGSELAAKWFVVCRSNLSGRHSKCRLGLTSLQCCTAHPLPSAHPPLTLSMPHCDTRTARVWPCVLV